MVVGTVWRLCVLVFMVSVSGCSSESTQKSFTVGITRWVDNLEFDHNIEGFKAGLSQRGESLGAIEFIERNPHADPTRQREILQEFRDKNVDLVYSLTTPGTLIAKEMMGDTPIVFSIVTYPAEAGVVQSVKNSGGSITGTRNWTHVGTQLSSFLKLVPWVKNIAFVHRYGEPNSEIQFRAMREEALSRGVEVFDVAVTSLEELPAQLKKALGEGADALYSACDTLVQGGGEEIVISFARANRLPDFTCNKSGVYKGSLMGTVADFNRIGRLAGEHAQQILLGADPSTLPITTDSKPSFFLNRSTAQALGIPIAQQFLAIATEVVD